MLQLPSQREISERLSSSRHDCVNLFLLRGYRISLESLALADRWRSAGASLRFLVSITFRVKHEIVIDSQSTSITKFERLPNSTLP
jgi:hypothetical protein